MRFGPFPERDIPAIEAVLKNLNIPYTADQDAELAAAEALNEGQKVLGISDPATHYVEFDESELSKLGDKLEPYGITQQSVFEPDFSGDDYYCPTCGAHSIEPGMCKTDNVQLMPREEFKKAQQAEDARQMNTSFKIILIGAGILLLGFLFTRFR